MLLLEEPMETDHDDNISNAVTHQFRLHSSLEREFSQTIHRTLTQSI